jgi:hypothetical protein
MPSHKQHGPLRERSVDALAGCAKAFSGAPALKVSGVQGPSVLSALKLVVENGFLCGLCFNALPGAKCRRVQEHTLVGYRRMRHPKMGRMGFLGRFSKIL